MSILFPSVNIFPLLYFFHFSFQAYAFFLSFTGLIYIFLSLFILSCIFYSFSLFHLIFICSLAFLSYFHLLFPFVSSLFPFPHSFWLFSSLLYISCCLTFFIFPAFILIFLSLHHDFLFIIFFLFSFHFYLIFMFLHHFIQNIFTRCFLCSPLIFALISVHPFFHHNFPLSHVFFTLFLSSPYFSVYLFLLH